MSKSKTNIKSAKPAPLPWVVELYDPRTKDWYEVAECVSQQEAEDNALRSSRMTGLTYRARAR